MVDDKLAHFLEINVIEDLRIRIRKPELVQAISVIPVADEPWYIDMSTYI